MVYCLLYYILDAMDDPDENSEKIEYFLFCFERGLGSWFCMFVCLFVLRDDNTQNKMMHTSDEYIICYTTITGIF